MITSIKRSGFIGCVAGVLSLLGCGTLTSNSNSVTISPTRRVYVNDPAANDSLMGAFAKSITNNGGLLFVLQPNESYHLRLATASAGDQLSLYGQGANNNLLTFGTLSPISTANDTETFLVQTNQTQAIWCAGILQAPDGTKAATRISHISLVSVDTAQSHTMNVNLIMVGNLSDAGLPDSASKVTFAKAFLTELGTIYQGANNSGFSPALTFNGTYSIAAADSAKVVLNFSSTFVPVSGKRIANAANLYLVDSIAFASLAAGEEVLGFSPREVVDMSTDENSRVILSARAAVTAGASAKSSASSLPGNGTASSNITNGIPSLATTTAHELGHFFGLRHPTATSVDLASDHDSSNKDDGFVSTPLCSQLSKTAAERNVSEPYDKYGFCLYVAVAGCPSTCDYTNLMFAYSCNGGAKFQRQLTTEQQVFFRKNLALLQGK